MKFSLGICARQHFQIASCKQTMATRELSLHFSWERVDVVLGYMARNPSSARSSRKATYPRLTPLRHLNGTLNESRHYFFSLQLIVQANNIAASCTHSVATVTSPERLLQTPYPGIDMNCFSIKSVNVFNLYHITWITRVEQACLTENQSNSWPAGIHITPVGEFDKPNAA